MRGIVWMVLLTVALVSLLVVPLLPGFSAVAWDRAAIRALAGAAVPLLIMIGAMVAAFNLSTKPVTQHRALLTLCLSSSVACLCCWLFHFGFEQYMIAMGVAMTWCIWDKVAQWRKEKAA